METVPLLIACDLGGSTHIVLQAGLALAQALGARPMLLHVDANAHLVNEGFHRFEADDLARMARNYREEARRALLELVAEVGGDPKEVEALVREGRTHEAVLATAAEMGALCVVMGSRVHAVLEHWLVGRTATRVARAAHVPVFTIDIHRPWRTPSRILFASDLQDDRRSQVWAARLTGTFGAELVILHVSELGSDITAPYGFPARAREEIRTGLEARLETVRSEVEAAASSHAAGASGIATELRFAGDPARTILEAAKEHDSDLIVLGTHGRRGLARAFLGSVAEGVAHRAGRTVVTVRDEPEAAPG
jgi:nucleotide-binding universal stress UspA family protein